MHPMSDELAASLFRSAHDLAWTGLLPLVLLLIMAAWTDARSHRIPNVLVGIGTLLAFVLHVFLPTGNGFASQLPGGLGFIAPMEGLGICLGLLFPCFAFGLMGAGDVKLIAMVGAFLGPGDIGGALLCIALAGGLLALIVALRHRMLGMLMRNVGEILSLSAWSGRIESESVIPLRSTPLPYAVPIAAGTFAYLLFSLYRAALIF